MASVSTRRSTRITRSASVEASDDQADQQQTGRPRRRARRGSVDSAGSVDSQAGRTTRATRRKTYDVQARDLSVVQEDRDADPEAPSLREATPQANEASETVPHRSPGAVSNISGTTAISSLSMADAAALDLDEMIDTLVDLDRWAAKLLEVVTPPEARVEDLNIIIKEMRIPESKTASKFRNREKMFEPLLETFTSPGHDFIRIDVVLKALFGSTASGGQVELLARPDEVLCKANLAALVKQLITVEREHTEAWQLIRELETKFPTPFLTTFAANQQTGEPGSSSLWDETFMICLDIRTQMAILALSQVAGNETPGVKDIIIQTFFDVQDEAQRNFETLEEMRNYPLRGWEIPGLGASETKIHHELEQTIYARVKVILDVVNRDSLDEEVIERLGNHFPWREFLIKLLDWTRLRSLEIDSHLRSTHGSSAPTKRLSGAVREYQDTQANGEKMRHRKDRKSGSSGSKGAKPKQTVSFGGLTLLKKLDRRVSGQDHQSPTAADEEQRPSPEGGSFPEEPATGQDEDDDARQEPFPKRPSALQRAQAIEMQRIRSQKNKENLRQSELVRADNGGQDDNEQMQSAANPSISDALRRGRFIDRQVGAQRIEFDEEFNATQALGQATQHSTRTKRQREDEDEDYENDEEDDEEDEEDDNDAFQDDTRQVDTVQRRREAPNAKRVRTEVVSSAPEVPPQSSVVSWQPTVQSAEETIEQRDEMFPQSSLYRQQMLMAKQRTTFFPNDRRARTSWTPQEEEHLVRLVARYQCQWRQFTEEKDDFGRPCFPNRSNVDLKDKARNMKMAYLKTGVGLPAGFDSVPLGPSYEAKLRRVGVNI